ncbi:MAG: ATPase-like protein, partial [Chthonomonadales bacterium]|nr:ATPase-like protein [Chthonomonadales bacterium]
GREEEIAEIAEALSRVRLVTLVGGGGVGKTRLSIEVAAGIDANTAQEVAFVALASLADPSLLPTFVVSALGIGKAASPDPALLMQGLIAWLAGREILLVLDNCEHLIEKTASLALELLERCPDLRILATSRQRLGLAGEIVWRVPSLPVPEVGLLPDALSEAVSAALNFPGIRLFFERACSAQREFQPRSREEVEAICRICRQLDGIPLAIELAAARVASLTVEDIAGRLDQRFRLLTGGSRAALPLQQTLRSLIDWSYDLLSAQERTLLGRLSVFTAGWTLEAAEEICVGGAVEEWEMLDLLTGLADKSLVLAEPQGASVRYRLLETVRLYGCERLEAAGERAEVQRRHSEFFLHMSEEAEARAETVGQMDLILRLGGEHDNLRTALEGSLHPLRFCAALLSFWQMRGHLSEGRTWCARALAREEAQAGTLERAKVLHVAGTLANLQGDYTVAQSSHEANLSIVRERGDRSGIAAALNGLGNVVFNQGDTVAARAYYAESLVLQRELGNRKGIGSALHNLGNVARSQGDYVAAQDCYAKSLTLFREAGNRGSAANALSNLGRVAAHQGDYAAARAYYEESLRLYREIGNRTGIAGALIVLGNLAYEQGDHSPARAYYEECLILYREFGERSGIGAALNNLGGVASHQGDYIAARGYYEESLRLFREIGHRPFLANTLHGLGSVMFQQGDQAMARTCHDESLRLQEEIGDRYGIAHSLAAISNMAVRADRPARAVLLWGAAEALREEIGSPLSAGEREHRDRDVAETRRMLGEEAFAAAWESGRTLTLKQAVRCALSEADA